MNSSFDFKRFPVIVGAEYRFRADNYYLKSEFLQRMRGRLESADKTGNRITIKIENQEANVGIPLVWDGDFTQFANQWELC